MRFTETDLLEGEHVIETKRANAVIKIDEHGLSRFAFDSLMWTIGMKNKEAIGGTLRLTNYRLVFQSHAFNRLKGRFSVFLSTIGELKDASGLIVKRLEVATRTQRFEFVVWGIPDLIAKIRAARDSISPNQLVDVRRIAASEFEKCGQGLKIFAALELINVAALTATKISQIVELAVNPVEVTSILNLLELFLDE